MNIGLWTCIAAVLMVRPLCACAQKVDADKGNIFLTDKTGKRIQLTFEGKDSEPCIDPKKRLVVFVRATPGKKIATGSGEEDATELRLVATDGKNPVMLLRGREDPSPKKVLAGLQAPQFSPDGRRIYFESAAYATSGVIHSYDLATKKVGYVCAGGGLEIVMSGEYAGDLLVGQHRYFLGGGSYDWYWLIEPNGKEVGPVGETTDNFKALYVKPGH